MKKIFSYVMTAMMVLVLVGGNGITVSAKTKKKPKMSASKITMTVGQKKTLKLKNYSKISKKKIKKVKWKTSDKKVVTVKASGKYRQQGKVTAKKIGKATISLKYNGKTYKCKVTVKSTGKKVTEHKTTEDKKTTAEQKTEQKKTNEKETDEPVVEKPVCNHKWDAGIIKKAVTCTEDGVIVYTCEKCGESNTETLEKSGHVWGTVYITDVEATTENEGSKLQVWQMGIRNCHRNMRHCHRITRNCHRNMISCEKIYIKFILTRKQLKQKKRGQDRQFRKKAG